jgi:hypothetical protein
MHYKLYTFVDITHTGQYRAEPEKESARWKEQNFNTILQTIGIRANVYYNYNPIVTEVKGSLVGFDTEQVVRLWRFDFFTEREFIFEEDGDPVKYLKDDFGLVPYIQGLDELLHQNYAVFITEGKNKNIVFHKKQ